MDKKKRKIIQLVMIVLIVGILFLCTILNVYSFRNSCVEAEADNTAVILSSITERLEFGLRYGRELDNYYDIDKVFSDAEKYCRAEEYYIFDTGLSPLYGTPPAEEMLEGLSEQIDQKQINEAHRMIWASHGKQHIVLPIHNAGGIAGYIGVSYSISQAEALTREYASRMYLYALIAALTGIVLFEILFRRTEHTDDRKVLRRLVMTTIIIVNASNSLSSYIVLNAGYEALSAEVADGLLDQSADNMERLLAAGVYYSDISDLDAYFRRVADTSAQVSTIALVREAPGDRMVRELPADGEGETRFLTAEISMPYVRAKVRTALINVIVTTITSMMIAMEILIFLVDLLVGERKNRRIRIKKDKDVTLETVGIVRGLSFCFAGFRFMAIAFMSIVLTEIYRPVTLFGYQVPYEILMSFPMSAQVFISMITSYVSGIVIYRRGWKGSAIGGVIMMCCGTLASAFASEPVSFILAQMLIGTGLGFAKMGIDVFAIVVASEKDMPEYTASSNAAIIVGYSCSASLGALIASTFGYSGAYLVMTGLGILAIALLYFFGINVSAQPEVKKAERKDEGHAKAASKTRDVRFPVYILFVIIPYFFIMMYTDYFFPVYANSVGVTTDVIGYVMLAYGIATAYIGTKLCPKLIKRVPAALLMPLLLLILAGSFLAFALHNMLVFAVLIVLLIGVIDGIMPSLQFMYVYSLPFAKRIGFSKALGIEGLFSNMIGAVAPVIFGVVMMYGNSGLGIVAVMIAVCAVLFLFINIVHHGRRPGEGVAG